MGAWRLILAWLVVVDHTPALREISHIEIGEVAVCTFFFVSGFLMPLTFATHYQGYGFLAGTWKFYVNRFLRIYPIYWLSLAVTLLCVLIYGPTLMEHARTLADLSRPGTYLSNVLLLGLNQTRFWGGDFRFNPPAWTLDVELQYYLLVPFILFMARRSWSAIVLVAIGIASVYLFCRPPQLLDLERWLLPWACFFLLGYAFYLSPRMQALASRKLLIIPSVVAALVFASLSSRLGLTILLHTLAFIGVSAYLLVLQQGRKFGRLDRLLGDLSYPTYVLHWICIQLIVLWLGNSLNGLAPYMRFSTQVALSILLSTLVAYGALRLIGDPIESIRRRIRDRRESRVTAPMPPEGGGPILPAQESRQP